MTPLALLVWYAPQRLPIIAVACLLIALSAVAGIVVKFGVGGLALVGIMAGLLLLVMGFTGLGSAVTVSLGTGIGAGACRQ